MGDWHQFTKSVEIGQFFANHGLRFSLVICILICLLIFTMLLAIFLGSADISISTVLRIIFAKILPNGWIDIQSISETQQIIIWSIRTPRVIVAALVGAALAIAGVQMQGLFQNPLASPDIVGISSGGALGAVLALITGLAMQTSIYLPILAFTGALLAIMTVYRLATWRGNTPVITLLLAGVVINALLNAIISFIVSISWGEQEMAREMMFWLMGGLDSRTWMHVWIALPGIMVGSIIALLHARELDILLMGQETAYALGMDVEQVKRLILVSTALLTGSAVAVSGVVSFVGLIIPHIVRLLIGAKHRYLLPTSVISGAIFLILMDLLARTLHPPEEIRLGILTAMLGAPFFLYLLLQQRREIG
jgi:iron complex transport system permease protein